MASRIKAIQLLSDETVASTASYTSDFVNVGDRENFTLWVKATSASGTPNISIDIYCGWGQDEDFAKPSTFTTITITNENANIQTLSIPVCRYIKVEVTGNTGNPSDTIVNLVIMAK